MSSAAIAFDEAAFRDDQAGASRQSVRLAALLGILAFVAFAFVDPFLAPQRLQLLLTVRVGVVLVLVLVFASTFLSVPALRSANWVLGISVATCLWIGLGVISVTALVGGAATNYHEALLLTFFAFSAFPLPWRWQQSMLVYGITVAGYDATMYAFSLEGSTAQWLTVNAVLWFAVVIASAITWHAGNLRRQEFSTRAQLAQANGKLQAVDAAKTAFFTNISHELRTPLTLVLAPLEAVLEDGSTLSPAQEEQLSLARRSALRLLRLVDDLLVLSRIEGAALKLYMSPLDLRALVARLTEEAAGLARRKRIHVTLDPGDGQAVPKILGDEEQIERVMLNVLANALKFTPAGGAVTVRVRAGAPRGGKPRVDIEVADSGPGIPEAERLRVFERFHQVEGSGRRFEGTGIGLSLAHQLVGLHGGEITAESNPGGGALLRVSLPASSSSRVESLPVKQQVNVGLPEWHDQIRKGDEYRLLGLDEATERRLGRRQREDTGRATVLVVEDNADMVRFLAGVLGSSYTVLAANNGQAGLRLATERRPDLVLSDVMMPEMTGWDLLSRLREDPVTRAIPVVLLTARGTAEDRVQGHAQGADAYLTKPFQVAELLTVVRGLLRNQDDRATQQADRNDEELDALLGGVMRNVASPAQALLRDPGDPRAAQDLARGLAQLTLLVPAASARETVDVNEMVQALVLTLGAAAGRVDLDLSARRKVLAAPARLQRALAELLDNALRASPPDRQVLVTSADEGEARVRITVRDDGPGIPAAARGRVFQPFYSTAGRPGLGLTLARRLARVDGGGLALDSQERPFGASFSISLPCDPSRWPPG